MPPLAEPVLKEISPLSPVRPASAVWTRNAPLEVLGLYPVLNSMDAPISYVSLASPTSIEISPAGPPTTSPVLRLIDPLDAWPPFAKPVLRVNDPLEPSLCPDGALAITAEGRNDEQKTGYEIVMFSVRRENTDTESNKACMSTHGYLLMTSRWIDLK